MNLSRRDLLRASLLAMAVAGGTVACGKGGGATADTKELTLWYWGGGLSDKVVADAVAKFSQVKLTPSVIGGDFKQKLITTMNGRKFVPDITGIKGENIASLREEANRFVDLNTLGADKIAGQFVKWKWSEATTKDGKQLGIPIDIGPTALYYRQDVFGKAGLPTEPAAVTAAMSTWDGYFAAGQRLKAAVPEAFMVESVDGVFKNVVGQSGKRFIDQNNHFIGDQDHIRKAWDTAVRAIELGIAAPKLEGQDRTAARVNGTLVSNIGAAWGALDLKNEAPDTAGKWRVAATPGGPTNDGGSFLALTSECRNPQLAFEIITWLLGPDNQAKGFTDAALFPTNPEAYKLPALTAGDPFFGGQSVIEVFGPAAEKVPAAFEAPADAAVYQAFVDELGNVWMKVKGRDAAWTDAVSGAKQIAERQGVS